MLTTLAAAMVLMAQPATDPLACAIMGSPTNEKSPIVEVNGFRFPVCCPGCDAKVEKDPAGTMAKVAKSGKTSAFFLFDPVSAMRLDAEDARTSMDYKGVRYYFETKANFEKFKADPAKYTKVPAKETLYCVVMKEDVKKYELATGYVDHNNVRYFMCCAECMEKFPKNPASYVGNATPKDAPLATKEEKKG